MFAGIYGGFLLGVRSVNGLAFYDWDNTELIRRIEIQPKHVSQLLQPSFLPHVLGNFLGFLNQLDLYLQIFWSDSGELVCIATEESFFILRYLSEKVAASQESNEGVTEDGIEDAFEVSDRNRQSCLIG